ncbi:18722_t:CDS:2, partial [Funneliformis geosporum]
MAISIKDLAIKADINLKLEPFFNFNYGLSEKKEKEELSKLNKDIEKYQPYTVRDDQTRDPTLSKKGISIFLITKTNISLPELSETVSVLDRNYSYVSTSKENIFKNEFKTITHIFSKSIVKNPHPRRDDFDMRQISLFKSKDRPIDPKNIDQKEEIEEGILDGCLITDEMLNRLRYNIQKSITDRKSQIEELVPKLTLTDPFPIFDNLELETEKERLLKLQQEKEKEGEQTKEQVINDLKAEIENYTIEIDKYFAFIDKYIKPKFKELKKREYDLVGGEIVNRLPDYDENCSKGIRTKLENNQNQLSSFITSLKSGRVEFSSEQSQNCILLLQEKYGIYITDNELPKEFLKT